MSRRKRYTRNFGRTLPAPAPVRTTVEWVRFEHRSEPWGVFSYTSEMRRELTGDARAELEVLLGWFHEHLGAPDDAGDERFWFRSEAGAPIAQARRLPELARAAGGP